MKPFYIGIDFGKTNVRYAISENEPELKYYTKETYSRGSAEEMHQTIFAGIDKSIAESEYNIEGLQGIGIAVPAVVDRKKGNIVWGPDWDFLAGASLTKPIEQRYGVPVVADVDTVIPTYGENWAGIGKTCKRFVLLTWGTGLGTGVVIDGKVQEHPGNLFPEFGHSMVSDDDWPCNCGARGCVDAMVCGPGIAKHGELAVKNGEHTLLSELCSNNPQGITSHMIFDAAEKGDLVSKAILQRIAILIGRLCANAVLTFQPEKIVIVGGLAKRSKLILETINKTMNENCWLLFKGLTKCDVVTSKLGDSAGVLGAIR
ncbi:MAG: ROK family protein, partial [Bacteroidales bacterium]|nr:ROK family protein [Bacteroidales bacterium]